MLRFVFSPANNFKISAQKAALPTLSNFKIRQFSLSLSLSLSLSHTHTHAQNKKFDPKYSIPFLCSVSKHSPLLFTPFSTLHNASRIIYTRRTSGHCLWSTRAVTFWILSLSPPPTLPVTNIMSHYTLTSGPRWGSTVVKALCYTSEGRWFDPSWCQWIFLLT